MASTVMVVGWRDDLVGFQASGWGAGWLFIPGHQEGVTMIRGWTWMAMAVTAAALTLGVGACATTNVQTETLLGQAGFRRVAADTPVKLAHLETLPARRLVGRTHAGKKYWVYADPEGCRCLYIGTPAQYQSYQSLLQQRQQFYTTGVEEAREWEIENSGLQ
jgi:hypothetical protein